MRDTCKPQTSQCAHSRPHKEISKPTQNTGDPAEKSE